MLWRESNGKRRPRRSFNIFIIMVSEQAKERKRRCPIMHEPSTI